MIQFTALQTEETTAFQMREPDILLVKQEIPDFLPCLVPHCPGKGTDCSCPSMLGSYKKPVLEYAKNMLV